MGRPRGSLGVRVNGPNGLPSGRPIGRPPSRPFGRAQGRPPKDPARLAEAFRSFQEQGSTSAATAATAAAAPTSGRGANNFVQPLHLSDGPTSRQFRCFRCRQIIVGDAALTAHWQERHAATSGPEPRAYELADEISHKIVNSTNKELRPYVRNGRWGCPVCEKTMHNNVRLKTHMYHHMVQAPLNYRCSICPDVAYSEYSSLYYHIKREHGAVYACSSCDKTFRLPSLLKTHVVNEHKGEAPLFPCPYCNRQFAVEGSRDWHKGVCEASLGGAALAARGGASGADVASGAAGAGGGVARRGGAVRGGAVRGGAVRGGAVRGGADRDEAMQEDDMRYDAMCDKIERDQQCDEDITDKVVRDEDMTDELVRDEAVQDQNTHNEVVRDEVASVKVVHDEAVPVKVVHDDAVPVKVVHDEAVPIKVVPDGDMCDEVVLEDMPDKVARDKIEQGGAVGDEAVRDEAN